MTSYSIRFSDIVWQIAVQRLDTILGPEIKGPLDHGTPYANGPLDEKFEYAMAFEDLVQVRPAIPKKVET